MPIRSSTYSSRSRAYTLSLIFSVDCSWRLSKEPCNDALSPSDLCSRSRGDKQGKSFGFLRIANGVQVQIFLIEGDTAMLITNLEWKGKLLGDFSLLPPTVFSASTLSL